MKNLFLYGTLRHIPLLEIVLGRSAEALDITEAILPGHHVLAVAEGPFPMIEQHAGQVTEGLLLRGLDADNIARLDFYEGSFDYDLKEVVLDQGQTAEVYFPQPGRWTPTEPWQLSKWQTDWAELSCHAAREVMGYMGQKSRDQVDAMFSNIRKRAASKVRAARSLHGAHTLHGKVDIQSQTREYAYFFALDEVQVSHEKFDGAATPVLDRAVFVAMDATVVLPYDPVRDTVLLVEQFRMGPLSRGDKSCWQLEPIAGHVDHDETPENAALREAEEEAGLRINSLEQVAQVYASPGNSTEFYYIFVGLADLPDAAQGLGGLDSEHEDIRTHVLSFDALMHLVETLEAANAPLVLAAYWLARHRARLRS